MGSALGPPPPLRHAAPTGPRWPRGQCWAPTPAHPRPQHVNGGPRHPPGGERSGEGERLGSDAPRNGATRATWAGGGAPSAYRNTPTPACGAGVRVSLPTPHRAHNTCTGHGKSAPHPLLLDASDTTMAEPAAPRKKHTPGLRRWKPGMRSSGRWDSQATTKTSHRRTRTRTQTATWR